jgi:hypothetical protein
MSMQKSPAVLFSISSKASPETSMDFLIYLLVVVFPILLIFFIIFGLDKKSRMDDEKFWKRSKSVRDEIDLNSVEIRCYQLSFPLSVSIKSQPISQAKAKIRDQFDID